MTDFRSERMPSPEGHGRAQGRFRQAWDAYARTVNRVTGPVVEPMARPVARWLAGRMIEDLVGFWLIWQLEGGFEGLQAMGMSRSAIYRRVASFRKHFGAHPDDFEMPGVVIDVPTYLAGRMSVGPRSAQLKAETAAATHR